jgi:hypothetical protein
MIVHYTIALYEYGPRAWLAFPFDGKTNTLNYEQDIPLLDRLQLIRSVLQVHKDYVGSLLSGVGYQPLVHAPRLKMHQLNRQGQLRRDKQLADRQQQQKLAQQSSSKQFAQTETPMRQLSQQEIATQQLAAQHFAPIPRQMYQTQQLDMYRHSSQHPSPSQLRAQHFAAPTEPMQVQQIGPQYGQFSQFRPGFGSLLTPQPGQQTGTMAGPIYTPYASPCPAGAGISSILKPATPGPAMQTSWAGRRTPAQQSQVPDSLVDQVINRWDLSGPGPLPGSTAAAAAQFGGKRGREEGGGGGSGAEEGEAGKRAKLGGGAGGTLVAGATLGAVAPAGPLAPAVSLPADLQAVMPAFEPAGEKDPVAWNDFMVGSVFGEEAG